MAQSETQADNLKILKPAVTQRDNATANSRRRAYLFTSLIRRGAHSNKFSNGLQQRCHLAHEYTSGISAERQLLLLPKAHTIYMRPYYFPNYGC